MARFRRGDETREAVDIEEQLALLGDGFVRLPSRENDDTGEPRDEALERAIHDNPDDDQAWLVYADLLIERGHPRGPLVALESAPVKNIVERAEREAETHRLRQAAGHLLSGSLAGRSGLNLRWKRGFIHSAKLRGELATDAAEALLVDLLAHPSARFMRELELACFHDKTKDHRLLVALILHTPAPPPLRKLVIDYDTMDWTGYPPLGAIGELGAVYPQLEDVRLDGLLTLDGLALPRAVRFQLNTVGLNAGHARALAAAPWPALRTLELELLDTTLPFGELAWIFGLPELRRLHLHNAPFAADLIAALIGHPVAAQLEALGLHGLRLEDRCVEQLVAARARFPEKFRLDANISSEARDMLDDANIDFERWWW